MEGYLEVLYLILIIAGGIGIFVAIQVGLMELLGATRGAITMGVLCVILFVAVLGHERQKEIDARIEVLDGTR